MAGDRHGWRVCLLGGAVFAVCMAGTTLPTPLYPLYQEKFGFPELTVTVVYAVYAFAVIGVLLLVGNASDAVGRRPVLLWGLGCAAASGVCFLSATGLGWLYAGRLLSGFSAGLFTGAATAYVLESAPPGGGSRATFVAAAVNMGGLGCGPLLAGLLAQYAAWPLRLPFAVHLALVTCSAVVLLWLPETVDRRRPLGTVRPQRPGVPARVRPVFGPAATASFVGFALFGVFTAVGPAFLARSLDVSNHAVSGAVVALAFFASTGGQLAVDRVGVGRSLPLGCAGLLAGLALLAGALYGDLLTLVVLSAVVGGFGQGLAFRGALSAVGGASPTETGGGGSGRRRCRRCLAGGTAARPELWFHRRPAHGHRPQGSGVPVAGGPGGGHGAGLGQRTGTPGRPGAQARARPCRGAGAPVRFRVGRSR